MARFYQAKKSTKSKQAAPRSLTVRIDDVSTQGEGVARNHSPVVFVDGALPGETVKVTVTKTQKRFYKATLSADANAIESPSTHRQTPFCEFYDQCGGCTTQHCSAEAMVSFKQQALDTQIRRQLSINEALPWLPPIASQTPSYRRKARLAVDARNEQAVRLGFRAAGSAKIIDISACPILEPGLQQLMAALHSRVTGSAHPSASMAKVGHITLLSVDDMHSITVNFTRDVSEQTADWWQSLWRQLVDETGIECVLVLSRNQQVFNQFGSDKPLAVAATDFVQVNSGVNDKMKALAAEHLNLQPHETLLDLFAGLGNFAFSLAADCATVTGVEGSEQMVQKANELAQQQGMDNVAMVCRDLSSEQGIADLLSEQPNKVLLDPSRDGALAVCQQLANHHVKVIVYISCNPQTWLRDAQALTAGNYQLAALTLMDMFPYTPHSELFSVFISQ